MSHNTLKKINLKKNTHKSKKFCSLPTRGNDDKYDIYIFFNFFNQFKTYTFNKLCIFSWGLVIPHRAMKKVTTKVLSLNMKGMIPSNVGYLIFSNALFKGCF